MGKKGALLRAQKAQKATYQLTGEQLLAHDQKVAEMAIERKRAELEEYVHELLEKDFKERDALLSGKAEDVTINLFSLLISISCRVLVERFGWKPSPMRKDEQNGGDRRFRLTQFAYYVQEEFNKILGNELLDIRRYAEEAYNVTGVKFIAGEEDE